MLWKNIAAPLFAFLPFQPPAMSNPAAVDQVQHPLTANPPYEAPLLGTLEEIVVGDYGVYLFPGHSLEQHFKAVKSDLTPHIMFRLDEVFKDQVVYFSRDVDDDLLAAIRSDPGVEAVYYNYKLSVD